MDHTITDNGSKLIWTLDHSPTCCRRLTCQTTFRPHKVGSAARLSNI